MYKLLKSTTSLTMCLALALPAGGFAQTTESCVSEGEQTVFPCVLPDGSVVADQDQMMTLRADGGLAEALGLEAEAQSEAEAQPNTEAAAETVDAAEEQAAAAAEAEADATAAAQQAAEEQAAADAEAAAAQAEAEAAEAQAAADAEAAAAAQAAEQEAAEAQAAADAQAAQAQEAAAAEAQAEAEREDAVAAQIAADAEANAAAEAEAEQAAADAVEPTSTSDADTAQQSDAGVEAQAETEVPAGTSSATETQADAETEPRTEEQIAADLAAEQAAEDAREEQRAADAAAAAEAAAAADSGETEAEVVVEEITEEDTRASNEEFSTNVSGDTAAQANTEAKKDDDGLSKFEKALLVGIGAVAVGAILKNGSKVVSNSGDRLVVQDTNGDLRVLKDDDALVRQAGDEVRRETFNDGSSRTTVIKPNGSQIVTILGRDGTVLRRINVDPQGNEYVLFDDTRAEERIIVNELPQIETQTNTFASQQDEEALRAALQTQLRGEQAQRYSLRQVRDVRQVRALAPEIELDAVRFATGSAAIQPEQARALSKIGTVISNAIKEDPRTVILIEGHTDAVGDAGYNLALSDRRAETVALALTEYFDVPPANLITQGYGESALKVSTPTAEPANRRAVVRNITGLLRQ
ncbi:MAG: OmpA family protein [Rhodobacterales bacterium]